MIVTAPRQRPEKALDNFIIAHAKATPTIDKIARWRSGICPLTIGLPGKLNRYVTERIVRVAMTARRAVGFERALPAQHHRTGPRRSRRR